MWVFRTQELLSKLSKHWRVPDRPCLVLGGQKMQVLSPGSLSSGCGRMQVPGKQQRRGGIGAGSEDERESEVCSEARTSVGKCAEVGEAWRAWLAGPRAERPKVQLEQLF